MKISDPLCLRTQFLGLAIIGGLCQSASATVITLPSVPNTVIFGARAENLSASAGGDASQIGMTSIAGPFVNLTGPTAAVTFAPSTSYPFTFSYVAGTQTASFTIAGQTVSQVETGLIPGSSFVLELINAGTSTTISSLALSGGASILAGYDLSYTTGAGSAVFRIPTTSLAGGFSLTGNFEFDAPNGVKNGFRVFVESPVPEPATIAFGTALVGGLVCCEARRRRKNAVRQ